MKEQWERTKATRRATSPHKALQGTASSTRAAYCSRTECTRPGQGKANKKRRREWKKPPPRVRYRPAQVWGLKPNSEERGKLKNRAWAAGRNPVPVNARRKQPANPSAKGLPSTKVKKQEQLELARRSKRAERGATGTLDVPNAEANKRFPLNTRAPTAANSGDPAKPEIQSGTRRERSPGSRAR